MVTFYDPYSTEELKKKLPEIQRAMRKAKKLRGTQAYFEGMRDREQPAGQMFGGGSGGLYQVPEFYVPNKAAGIEKAIGALGSYYTEGKGDTAEDELNALRNPEIIDAIQQMGYSEDDVAALMQRSLGLPGGGPPDPNDPRVAPASAAASGAAPPMGPEAPLPPGVPQVPGAGGMTPPFSPMGPRPQMPGGPPGEGPNPQMPSAGGATASAAGSAAGGQQQGFDTRQITELNPQQQEELQKTLTTLDQLGIGDDVITEVILRAKEAAGLPPGQKLGKGGSITSYNLPTPETPDIPPGASAGASPVEQALGQSLQLPQGRNGPLMAPDGSPIASDATLRAYLGMIGGPELKDIIKPRRVQSRFEGENGNMWVTFSDGSGPEDTGVPYKKNVKPVQMADGTWDYLPESSAGTGALGGKGGAGAGGAGGAAPPRPLRTPTPGEIAGSQEAAKIAANLDTSMAQAGAAAEKAAAETAAKGDVEFQQAAIVELPNMEITLQQLERDIPNLVNHPQLGNVVGGGLWGRLGNVPLHNIIEDMGVTGKPEADVIARLDQMKGEVFLPAFRFLKGGGQITNLEGQKAEQAMARMSRAQTAEDFTTAMNEFLENYRIGYQKRKEVAEGKYKLSQFDPSYAGAGARQPAQAPSGPAPKAISPDEAARRQALRDKYK